MDDEPLSFVAAGISTTVWKAAPETQGREGFAFAAVTCPVHGEPLLAMTVIHKDGSALSVFLDEALIDRAANQMAAFVEALPRLQSVVRH